MEPLTVPATLDSLSVVGRYVMRAAEAAAVDRKRAYRLRLAVDEIVTNIIVHGYQEAGIQGTIALRVAVDPQSLMIVVEDTAKAFDPRQVPPPTDLDGAIEDRPIGGLGLFLAMQGVDQFRYEHVNGRNRNILVTHRTPAPLDSASTK